MEENIAVEKKQCRIKRFLEREHTPLEKGLMLAASAATGLALGMLLSPATDGIEISVARGGINLSIGSGNGAVEK